jgi:alginate O-acetyltransferase complex protein AlgI
VKYRDVNDQIVYREQSIEKIADGLRRFICGLAKKVLIANTMGQTADIIFSSGEGYASILTAWIGALTYLFQIYYDFSGYSDMAIGLGKMFGFDFKENFNYPYGAVSVQDFWRRWHISLSTWFKEYLYIPLGGNRKGRTRAVINRLIVFFCTGLWHGANWTFVLWGIYHGFFLLLEEFVPVLRKLPKVINHIYTLLAVTVGFVIFRADTITQGFDFIGNWALNSLIFNLF